jgi:hypothetical protein
MSNTQSPSSAEKPSGLGALQEALSNSPAKAQRGEREPIRLREHIDWVSNIAQ